MIEGKRNARMKRTGWTGLKINRETERPQSTKNQDEIKVILDSTCYTRLSFHLLHAPALPSGLFPVCWCGEALFCRTQSSFRPQQGLPCVVSNQSFLSVELGWAYHTRLCKWSVSPYLGCARPTWLTWFELTGKFVSHCSLNTVCPVSLVLSIVEWMGPVFVGDPNDKPRCPQAK